MSAPMPEDAPVIKHVESGLGGGRATGRGAYSRRIEAEFGCGLARSG
jgi:hypothetical protein